MPKDIEAFTRFDDVVTLNEGVRSKANEIVAGEVNETAQAKALFEWVRDRIPHTKDIEQEVVTCTSTEVLEEGTGICFAKSHLLAAMMRHAGIPCGFCYQVFENPLDLTPDSLALHGLNAIWLSETGRWHRMDPRGNRDDIHAEFSLLEELLAFPEMRFLDDCIYAAPLDQVVAGLRGADSITTLWPKLPSVAAASLGEA